MWRPLPKAVLNNPSYQSKSSSRSIESPIPLAVRNASMTATIRRAPRSLTQKMVVGGTNTDSCMDFLLRLKKLREKIQKLE